MGGRATRKSAKPVPKRRPRRVAKRVHKTSPKPHPAEGVTGFLLTVAGETFFRVYEDGGFRDYQIAHCDLEVRILDGSAHLYPDPGTPTDGVLDYSPEVLGGSGPRRPLDAWRDADAIPLFGRLWRDGKWWAIDCPAIGATTQGRTRDEAMAMLVDWVRSMLNDAAFRVRVELDGGMGDHWTLVVRLPFPSEGTSSLLKRGGPESLHRPLPSKSG